MVIALASGAGIAAPGEPPGLSDAEPPGQQDVGPACEAPPTGFLTSAGASNFESLQPGDSEINPGVENALKQNGCDDRLALLNLTKDNPELIEVIEQNPELIEIIEQNPELIEAIEQKPELIEEIEETIENNLDDINDGKITIEELIADLLS